MKDRDSLKTAQTITNVTCVILASFTLFKACQAVVETTTNCINDNNSTAQSTLNQAPDIQTFYKTIDVEIIDIRTIWQSNKEIVWTVTVKSSEYNIQGTFQVVQSPVNSDRYATEIYSGKIKVGYKIHAEMISEVVNGSVAGRSISHLKE